MSKLLKKIGRIIWAIIESIYNIIDKILIMPISRIVYRIKKATGGSNNLNKLLNRPNFLIVISLVFALVCFWLIDAKVINLVENEAEIIKNVPVNIIYNEEAYVVDNVPSVVDIIITGRKSDIYLAKQLGDFAAELDLSKYTEPGTYRVDYKCSEAIDSVSYRIDPSYLYVTISNRVSEVHSVTYDLVSMDELNEKLSVDSVSLNNSEVVVKGSPEALKQISSIKALVSVSGDDFTAADTYELTNIPVIAYDKKGEIIKNIEIVPNNLTGSLVLKSYKATVPISVNTTGELINGKAIASISVNNSASYTLDVYGEEQEIKNITSVPVTLNIDGLGSDNVKTYKVNLIKPNGIRSMSAKNVTIKVTFGDAEQKSIEVGEFVQRNLANGYTANTVSPRSVTVQVIGVKSNIDKIEANNIKAYVDLSGLTEGTHQVEVKIDNNNPLIKYVVTNNITVNISKD